MSYVFGSISSAIIVCKLAGLEDPRVTGSKNPGVTNVLRIGGKKLALITLLGDTLKGFIPTFIAVVFGFSDSVIALVALMAFIGHLFPVFFRFQGGKGIATAFGVVFGLNWYLGFFVALVWIIIATLFKYSSLAGLLSFLSAPFWAKYYFNSSWEIFFALLTISILTTMRHKTNILRLLSGDESKIVFRAR